MISLFNLSVVSDFNISLPDFSFFVMPVFGLSSVFGSVMCVANC